jgi:hypothetical protein
VVKSLIRFTVEYCKVEDEFRELFGYGVPLEQIPPSETTEGIISSLTSCISEGKDILTEIYSVQHSDDILY